MAIRQTNTESKNLENDEYIRCFRYITLVMKILGIFPFFPIHEAFNVSQLLSNILTIISVLLYFGIVAEDLPTSYSSFVKLLKNFNFISFVSFVPRAAFTLLVLCAPCLTWNNNKQQRSFRNNWMRFQLGVEKLTRSPYKCSLRKRIQCIFAIWIICMSAIPIAIKIQSWNENTPFIPTRPSLLAGLYVFNGIANVVSYWVVNNTYIRASAKKINDLVRHTMSRGRDADLRHLIDLWIMLCDLSEEFNNNQSVIFLFLFGINTIVGVVNAFSAIFLLISIPDKGPGLIYFSGTVICMLGLMRYCESANLLTKYMIYKLRETLLSGNVINKNINFSQTILLFLQTIETKNPQITLYGFMSLDRSVVSSILGTSIYFLVVLKQFSPT